MFGLRLNFLILLAFALSGTMALSADLPALQTIFSFFGDYYYGNTSTAANKSKHILRMTLEELGVSQGQCLYDFVDFVGHKNRYECALEDQHIVHLLLPIHGGGAEAAAAARKPPIMVKCLQPEINGSYNVPELQIMHNVKDIVTLLKPIGNATKRHEMGSCVLVLFYTPSSLACAHVAPYANALPFRFPTLRIAAIDAFNFPSFNTEFGIVGLPTLLLFHQGRPIVKFYSDVGTFSAFVTRHTGIKPVPAGSTSSNFLNMVSLSPLPIQPVGERDFVLLLAWTFIILCIGNYFAKSLLFQQFVEMIKCNWRESEAQLEHN